MKRLIVTGALVASLLVPAAAVADNPNPDCVGNPHLCEAGPQGPEGPQGPVGPQGPQGPQGETGQDGANGLDGASGERGANGTNGSAGASGVEGVAGAAGVSGAPGQVQVITRTVVVRVKHRKPKCERRLNKHGRLVIVCHHKKAKKLRPRWAGRQAA